MQDRRDAGQETEERCRTGEMQDRRLRRDAGHRKDAGQVRCRTGGMQDGWGV